MGIGSKIKEYRIKAGLTQKDLADELHVTYQAVSRWENNDAEPSIDTLREMCRLLNCSMDDLFEVEKVVEQPKQEENTVQEIGPVLAVCENCNKPIYDSNKIKRVTISKSVGSGRQHHIEHKNIILCDKCDELRMQEEKRKEEEKKKEFLANLRKKRIHSFIWPGIALVTFVILGILSFTKNENNIGILYMVLGVLAYCFLATMILNNTFITDLWLEVSSWGFVKLPGIIFELSFNGLIFLILVKALFFVLGIALAILAAIFATALAMALSIFVYPFALTKNIKGRE